MVVEGIKTLSLQTAKIFLMITFGVGCSYTILRYTEDIVRSLFGPSDMFYDLLNWISVTELALWGVIGVTFLFSLLVAVTHMATRSARYVNNDSYADDDQFGKW